MVLYTLYLNMFYMMKNRIQGSREARPVDTVNQCYEVKPPAHIQKLTQHPHHPQDSYNLDWQVNYLGFRYVLEDLPQIIDYWGLNNIPLGLPLTPHD